MIMAGKNITQANDPLQKITLEYLYKSIVEPKQALREQIDMLRIVMSIDEKKYRQLKTQLPYIVCGIFHPSIRRTENFACIQHFFLDIDHISEKQKNIDELKKTLIADSRLRLMFISPGGDGLKLLFTLSEKCYDSAKFSLFYKTFTLSYSKQYNLDQLVDRVTSDVTRACFISYDQSAYYNEEAEEIIMNSFINFDNHEETKLAFKELKQEQKKEEALVPSISIDNDIIQQIKEKLNPNIKIKREKIIYVPEELNNIIEDVKTHIESYNIVIQSIENIHYGKKMVFTLEHRKAEINLFYGKKGFSVVITPKQGCDMELSNIVHKIICEKLIV